jgi:hypothetical protein
MRVGRSLLRRPNFFLWSPSNFVDSAPKRPVFRSTNQYVSNRIFPSVLPFLGVTFAVPQSMMKTAVLERAMAGTRLGETVLPKPHPSLDGKFQIVRRAKQMQMVGHQHVVAHQPGCGLFLPYLMQCLLHGRLRQPRGAFFCAGRSGIPNWDRLAGCVRLWRACAARGRGASRRTSSGWIAEWESD